MDEAIKTLAAWLQESKKAVFFGGAGVSTSSGIPDFRSTDGLYNQQIGRASCRERVFYSV